MWRGGWPALCCRYDYNSMIVTVKVLRVMILVFKSKGYGVTEAIPPILFTFMGSQLPPPLQRKHNSNYTPTLRATLTSRV
jgi:hypothetical protein